MLLEHLACSERHDHSPYMLSSSPTQVTEAPTDAPTDAPIIAEVPADVPAEVPTAGPTEGPTEVPTEEPTAAPTEGPTDAPIVADVTTDAPSDAPTHAPTLGLRPFPDAFACKLSQRHLSATQHWAACPSLAPHTAACGMLPQHGGGRTYVSGVPAAPAPSPSPSPSPAPAPEVASAPAPVEELIAPAPAPVDSLILGVGLLGRRVCLWHGSLLLSADCASPGGSRYPDILRCAAAWRGPPC